MATAVEEEGELWDKPIPEKLLARLAHRVYPQHLHKFATTLLDIEDAKFHIITYGGETNAWQRSCDVLIYWYRQGIRRYRHFIDILRKAEDLGFVQRNTATNILQGDVWKYSYLTKSDNEETRDEFSASLRMWYRHPDWQSMLLYPWMKMEETFRLSEAYCSLEMESLISRQVRPLKHYADIFKQTRTSQDGEVTGNEGSRFLIQGNPGIGKTTFTHKLALDWADGQLGQFDFVFVVKLRELLPEQTIPNAIIAQIKTSDETEETANRHLIEASSKTLLILDGLDEIDLKSYAQVKRVLSGEDYPACCVLVTSRPHLPPAMKSYMTCITNITGFSKKSAEEYASHIIPSPEQRQQFFKQLTDRKMKGMYKVPIILQALALLFVEEAKLPSTYTLTYDELATYLLKTCESSQSMNTQEVEEAMNAANELAFKGLTKSVQQLVFPREAITNENVFRLGILSGTKSVTGLKPTSTVQFPHKTVQEYSAAAYVAKELEGGYRGPWEIVKKIFKTSCVSIGDQNLKVLKKSISEIEFFDEDVKAIIINNATQKFVNAIVNSKEGKVAAVKGMFKVILDKGFLEDEPDIPTLWLTVKSFYATQSLTEEELDVGFDFVMELLQMADSEQKANKREWVHELVHSNNNEAWKFAQIVHMITAWMNASPSASTQLLKNIVQKRFTAGNMVSFHSNTTKELWLQEWANGMKILFRFILGKLSPAQANEILGEIAETLVDHAFDPSTGEVLSIHFLKQYIQDLMPEADLSPHQATNALYSSDTCALLETTIPVPAIIHIKGSASQEMNRSSIASHALKIEEITSESLRNILDIIKNTNNLKLVEVASISSSVLTPDHCKQLAKPLSSKDTIVSISLHSVNAGDLCNAILYGLPSSTKRLTLMHNARSDKYEFPPEAHLQYLYIEETVSGVTKLFTPNFPSLKTLSIMSTFTWTVADIKSLHSAVTEGRMPFLKHLGIRFGNLSSHGKYILDIIQIPTMRTVDLMDTNLSEKDGRILLAALREGQLSNIQSLNILHNNGLNPPLDEFISLCSKWHIELQCSQISKTSWFWDAMYSTFETVRKKCIIL